MSKVDTIKRIFEAAPKQFEPYIQYIRFPHYKQLIDGSRIDFYFPLTVLVGPNGCNKSSILQACYGCPGGNSTGSFWFSTSVDAIDMKNGRPSCIHGYWSEPEGDIVEVLKQRIYKYNNPDYWEPSRPVKKYGMKELPPYKKGMKGRSETRWNPIEKNIVYLDFRNEIGAYDKYFWFGDLNRTVTINTKQDHIRFHSRFLRKSIDEDLKSYLRYNKQKIRANKILPTETVTKISEILGHRYNSIRIIEHSFYGKQPGNTVILVRADMEYSEAFAGSGETAVVILVDEIMSAQEKSLILIDEPESSLHPKAQQKLQDFLFQQIIEKKHQIVLATHSPTLVSGLPPEAIKVMLINPKSNKVKIIPKSFPEEAFQTIGVTDPSKLNIFVEDKLSKAMIEVYIQKYKNKLSGFVTVTVLPGGAESILQNFVNAAAQRNAEDEIFVLDGDKHFSNRDAFDDHIRDLMDGYISESGFVDPLQIPESENVNLGKTIKELAGCDIAVHIDGNGQTGGNKIQKYELQRNLLSYWSEHVFFLPGRQPEELLYNSLGKSHKKSAFGNDFDPLSIDWKEFFKEKAEQDLAKEKVTSEDILSIQRQLIAKFPEDCEVFVLIGAIVEKHFESRREVWI